MVHRCTNEGNPHRGGDRVLKIVHFDRDMALIMVERQYRIKLTCGRPIENTVCRIRAHDIQPLGLQLCYCRSNLVNLLTAQHAFLAAVRVQRSHSYPGHLIAFTTPTVQRIHSQAQFIHEHGLPNVLNGFGQGFVCRQMGDLEPFRHQHGCSQRRSGFAGQNFLMTDITNKPCRVHRRLVDRTRHHTLDLT